MMSRIEPGESTAREYLDQIRSRATRLTMDVKLTVVQ
jgi:hypothetical protein